jgi:hypothetical protein
MNKKDIIKLYRREVENRMETPPESCWEEIKNRLDIEETWDAIAFELDRILPDAGRKKNIGIRRPVLRLLAAASLLLFTLIYTSDSLREPQSLSRFAAAEQIPDSYSGVTSMESSVAAVPEYRFSDVKVQEISGSELSVPPLPEITFIYNITALESRRPFVKSNITDDYYITSDLSELSNSETGEGYPTAVLKKFSAGISFSGKNTWMLSEETFDGLGKDNLNTTRASFLNDLGIIVGYSLNEKWSFKASGFLSSHNGQSYKQYINGLYSDKTYRLRYSSFELTAGRSLTRPFSPSKVRFSVIAGGYVSYLHSAYKVLNNSDYNISAQYKPVDYGIIAGTDFQIPLYRNFGLMPGLRFKYGIPNIFAGQFPNDLRTVRNASLEFRLGLMFQMKNF